MSFIQRVHYQRFHCNIFQCSIIHDAVVVSFVLFFHSVKKEASFEEMEVDPVIISNTSTSNRGDQLTVSELFTPSEAR